ncbi:hypothetical protein V8C86DRAFT_2652658 [Haematococcus lacustris]
MLRVKASAGATCPRHAFPRFPCWGLGVACRAIGQAPERPHPVTPGAGVDGDGDERDSAPPAFHRDPSCGPGAVQPLEPEPELGTPDEPGPEPPSDPTQGGTPGPLLPDDPCSQPPVPSPTSSWRRHSLGHTAAPWRSGQPALSSSRGGGSRAWVPAAGLKMQLELQQPAYLHPLAAPLRSTLLVMCGVMCHTMHTVPDLMPGAHQVPLASERVALSFASAASPFHPLGPTAPPASPLPQPGLMPPDGGSDTLPQIPPTSPDPPPAGNDPSLPGVTPPDLLPPAMPGDDGGATMEGPQLIPCDPQSMAAPLRSCMP